VSLTLIIRRLVGDAWYEIWHTYLCWGRIKKKSLVVCCQVVFLVSRFDWSVEVEYSSWRLRRQKKKTPQSSRLQVDPCR